MKQRLALCVGINDYPGTGQDLRGCVNDAHDWAAALTAQGFEVLTLVDHQATKAEVTARLRERLSALKRSDDMVFTYSGHGTNVPDHSGDEEDKRDEALVLYDFRSGGLLVDDEMALLMEERARGSFLLTLSDSCHSGTMIDRLPQPLARSAVERRTKFLDPTVIGVEPRTTAATPTQTRTQIGSVLISGCADGEYSWDTAFAGRPNGAFTYQALKSLREVKPTSIRAWHTAIRLALPTAQLPQTPQLSGSWWASRRKNPLLRSS